MLIQENILIFLSYIFLYLAVASLWITPKHGITFWKISLIIAIVFGLFSQQIEWIGLIPIFLLLLTIYYSQQKISILKNNIVCVIILFLSIGLGAHLFPGFHNLKVIDNFYISKDAIPFTMLLSFDTPLVGIFILGMTTCLIYKKNDWLMLFKKMIFMFASIIFVVSFLAFLFGVIHFDPKLPYQTSIWAITNLLFVSTAEEAFFRGFIQKKISSIMHQITFGNYIAIFIAAILFGLAHYRGGINYILLATIAGIGYGWIYNRTKHIEASILTHFSLNLTHFLFFTYPMLNSSSEFFN